MKMRKLSLEQKCCAVCLSFPFPSSCLLVLAVPLSSLGMAKGHAVSGIAVVILLIPVQSALVFHRVKSFTHLLWAKLSLPQQLCVLLATASMGKPEQMGEAGVGH